MFANVSYCALTDMQVRLLLENSDRRAGTVTERSPVFCGIVGVGGSTRAQKSVWLGAPGWHSG